MKALPWVIAAVGIGTVVAYLLVNEPAPQAQTGWDSVEGAANEAWKFGSKARISGTGTSAVGKIKEGAGRFMADPDLADEGVADQAVGSAKDAVGKVAHAVGETIHDLNR